MRVLYDYQAFMQRGGGVSRYFSELMDALRRVEGFEARLPRLYSDNEYLTGKRALITRRPFKGKVRIMTALNRLAAARALKDEFDLFHPTYYSPYFLDALRRPFVVTVHDMIHELHPEHVRDDGTAANKRLLCQRASRIIAVSQNTKNDLCKLLHIPAEKVAVIHHGTNMIYDGSPRLEEKPYLLQVGGRAGYKNFIRLLQAAAPLLKRHDLSLVCAGGEAFSRAELEAMRRHGIHDRVRLHGVVSSRGLASLYHFAVVLCYPSLYEGFGLPLLEAFACGCPVAASGTSSIPEVAGEAAELFDPDSPDSIAAAIERILANPSRSRELVLAGRARLASFSWSAAAERTMEVYRTAS